MSNRRLQSPFDPSRPGLASWRDGPSLWNEWARGALLERRAVLIDRPLDDGMAGQAASELMLLDAEGDDAIQLRIDSEGGTVGAALTLIDVIDLLGVAVNATCTGRADGPPLALLAVCDHRSAAPHARLRWGDACATREGSASELLRFAEQQAREVQQLAARVATATQLSEDEVRDQLARRHYLGVDDALRLGVIDEVLAPEARVLRFPRHIGFER